MKQQLIALIFCMTSFVSAETTFLLIRHGETNANLKGITAGWTDVPLNEQGLQQAANLANQLWKRHSDIAVIYSSDLSRAYATAKATASLFQLPIVQDSDLREMYCGEGEGYSQENREECLQCWKSWDQPIYPKGETYSALIERVKRALCDIAQKHPGQKVAIFTHGRSMHAIAASLSGRTDFPLPKNCQVFLITKEANGELQWKGEELTLDALYEK